jgi:hypothetical protein
MQHLDRNIKEHFNFMWDNKRGFDTAKVLKGLPEVLSRDITWFLAKVSARSL